MNKKLRSLMNYKWIYRLIPRWYKFLYSFETMLDNKDGTLHLENGYALDFKTMTIEKVN